MRIDLHTHSGRSDGTLSPAELVRAAAEGGLDVVALTDHDTTEGWQEAADVAERSSVALVRGIEMSCSLAGYGVHLLAYLPDPTYPPLAAELRRVVDGRSSRLPAILERLRGIGIEVTAKDVRRVAPDAAAMGRPHVADALVATGVVANRDEAFDRFLGPQGPAYVPHYAPRLETAIGLVTAAGGASVVAHPWARRHNHDALDRDGFVRLRRVGLAGVEVDHEDHDAATRTALRELAADLDLVATGSSDFHGSGKTGHDLGCHLTDPEQYAELLRRAAAAAEASGRRTPEVVS